MISTPSAASPPGNRTPQSITRRDSELSTDRQFIPTSPRPPSGTRRTGAGEVCTAAQLSTGGALKSVAPPHRRRLVLHAPRGRSRQRAQPAAAGSRPARGGAAPHPGGRPPREDPRAHPPHRVPLARAEGPPGGDPRGHLHQQGGGRAEEPGGEAGRSRRGAALGGDLPRGRRADLAARSGVAG